MLPKEGYFRIQEVRYRRLIHAFFFLFKLYIAYLQLLQLVGHMIIFLSGFHHRPHLFGSSQQLIFVFVIDCTYMINHVIILFGFHHRPHQIRQVLIVQFQFQRRPDLYYWSHHCHVQISSQTKLDLIGHDDFVSFSTQTAFVQSITQLSYLVFIIVAPNPISHDNSISFSTQTAPVRLVTSLSCLAFFTKGTRSDR